MTNFEDVFTRDDDRMLMRSLGDVVSYCGKQIYAMVQFGNQSIVVQDFSGATPRITITALKEDVKGAKRGSVFKYNNKSLVVDGVINESNFYITLSLNYD